MQGYALGNDATAATVLRMGEINLDGNVIPHSWYEHLRYPNGKPNLNAIIILAEVVYWYRPIVLKDEKTGRVLPARKKFEGEHLQRTRKSFAEQFGLTTKQVKDALNFLEEKKVVEVIIAKSLKIANGKKLGNVPYIALDAEKVAELNRPLVPVSPSLGTCKSEPSVPVSPTNTETTYTETINTKRPLRANDARAEPPQAMLFDDSVASIAPKPPVTPPEKKPRQPDAYLDTIMLLWQVPAQRAATIKQQLQGRVPKSKPHHHTNLSPPVELEEAIEFATRYYPRACKGCSLPKSPEKLQDHVEAMRREKGQQAADIKAGGVNIPGIGHQPFSHPEFDVDYYE